MLNQFMRLVRKSPVAVYHRQDEPERALPTISEPDGEVGIHGCASVIGSTLRCSLHMVNFLVFPTGSLWVSTAN